MAEKTESTVDLVLTEAAAEQSEPTTTKATSRLFDFFKEFYTSSDWFAAYIGLFWFFVAMIMIAAGYQGSLGVPDKWTTNPLEMFTVSLAFVPLLYVIVSLQILFVLWSNGSLKRGKQDVALFYLGFTFQFMIGFVCMSFGMQETLHKYGLGYEIWAIILGIIIINITAPFVNMSWTELATSQGEFYIKCGLVLLGVDLERIIAMGFGGCVVGWVVPPLQIIFMWLIGTRVLKIENKVMVAVLAVGASVCGCSAMAAVAPALKMPKEDLGLCISLLTLFTLAFTFILPLIAIGLKMSEDVAGAWLGGSVNNTANVIAAAGLVGPEAVEVAGIVKMIQNCALGFIVVGVSMFWSSRGYDDNPKKPGFKMLWDKFPKFAIGFFMVSIIITITSGPWSPEKMTQLDKIQADARSWLFTLGFVGIGLTTNIPVMMKQLKGGLEVAHYLIGQTFNVLVTLLFAWVMFDVI